MTFSEHQCWIRHYRQQTKEMLAMATDFWNECEVNLQKQKNHSKQKYTVKGYWRKQYRRDLQRKAILCKLLALC